MERLPITQRVISGVALGVGALTMGACASSPEILPNRPATVIEHRFDDADDWITPICAKTCMFIPQHDNAHYYLQLEQCDRSTEDAADERGCVTVTKEVKRETYEEYPDGSQITFTN